MQVLLAVLWVCGTLAGALRQEIGLIHVGNDTAHLSNESRSVALLEANAGSASFEQSQAGLPVFEKLTNSFVKLADSSAYLEYLEYLPMLGVDDKLLSSVQGNFGDWTMDASTLSDKIPGIGRCVAGILRLSLLIYNNAGEIKESAKAEENDESNGDATEWRESSNVTRSSISEMTSGAEEKVYEDVLHARTTLWRGLLRQMVKDTDTSSSLVSRPNVENFFDTKLFEVLKHEVVCDDEVTRQLHATDEHLRLMLALIEDSHRTEKGRFLRPGGGKSQFELFKERMIEGQLLNATQIASQGSVLSRLPNFASRSEKQAIIRARLKHFASSDEGHVVEASVMLAKAVVTQFVLGGSGVLSACDVLHCTVDLATAAAAVNSCYTSRCRCNKLKEHLPGLLKTLQQGSS